MTFGFGMLLAHQFCQMINSQNLFKLWFVLGVAISLISCDRRILILPDASVDDGFTPEGQHPDPLRPEQSPPSDLAISDQLSPDRSSPDSCAPEVCNGIDDDCDGLVDEAQEVAAECAIPTAYTACEKGTCVIVSCHQGYADCDHNPGNECEPVEEKYVDADADGYGDSAADPVGVCPNKAGFVLNADDCDDQNADVHPGQETHFTLPRDNGTFDYNCDGIEELQYPNPTGPYMLCSFGTTCSMSPGWADQTVPACGKTHTFETSCVCDTWETFGEERVQGCR